MGRQIAVALEPEDEVELLAFLRASADIVIYRSWSPAPDSVSSFVPDLAASPFYVHNQAFPWRPEFELVQYKDQVTEEPNHYYRLLSSHAPLLEYSRHSFAAKSPQVAGRLYWQKLFASRPDQLQYDIPKFDAWFSSIARWVRRSGRKVRHGSTEPWCLPAAQRRLENEL